MRRHMKQYAVAFLNFYRGRNQPELAGGAMITFLSKLLIKDYRNYASPAVRTRYGMLCG
ncbi:MAG: hypothetical protein HGB11_15370, partial [Chlorobiales bacterium]|nr:hypothetical protein [Chlorobiales bacterium]